MKYRALAKAYQFVKGSLTDPTREDAIWLTGGEKKKFTDKQLEKLNTCYADLVEKAQAKLESQGLDFDEMLKHMPQPDAPVGAPGPSTEADEEDDE